MIPSITKQNGHAMLTVHGAPYIIIAGEVHNSNSSSVEYMESVWDKAEALVMNTLLLPIPWETVEFA